MQGNLLKTKLLPLPLMGKCVFLQANKTSIAMEAAVLNPTQMHLLKLFAFNNSEDYAREIQMVLTKYFQQKLDEESDCLWESGVLDQERLDEIRKMDLHAK
jgi:hypothetical protein